MSCREEPGFTENTFSDSLCDRLRISVNRLWSADHCVKCGLFRLMSFVS